MRTLLPLLLTVAWLAPSLDAQATSEVWEGIRNGGGWVSIPIEEGVGSFKTVPLPTAGITLAGCVNVWAGHTGEWEIRAKDNLTERVLRVTARPGEAVRFSHTFGLQSQIDFEFRWSEPRDTTLVMWVGLGVGREVREEACTPKYGG